ncbi:MAG: tRNA1(Val) (adenine(37)-N6)-methyltransferase [Bacteroidota bacterium]
MPNPWFKFKQFTIWHDKCAMKVGTDGVLLGAWVQPGEAQRMLDIGTGTGLLALMMAQKTKALITAVDIDKRACSQANENALKSPWPERIKVIHADFIEFATQYSLYFDFIICNPPYFKNSLPALNESRTKARHNTHLQLESLLFHASGMLTEKGKFALILPAEDENFLLKIAKDNDLFPARTMYVKPTPAHNPKRILLELQKEKSHATYETLVIEEQGRHQYSEAYKTLTRDFYLKF